jgi:hypothetical protein
MDGWMDGKENEAREWIERERASKVL